LVALGVTLALTVSGFLSIFDNGTFPFSSLAFIGSFSFLSGVTLSTVVTSPPYASQHRYIFHKNREISILTIKKKTARLTLLQEATERTKQGETQNKTKHEKHTAV
jgi:hypothetical protein